MEVDEQRRIQTNPVNDTIYQIDKLDQLFFIEISDPAYMFVKLV